MSKLYVNEVHSKTGSTKAIEIDSDGHITNSQPIGFYAVLGANQSGDFDPIKKVGSWNNPDDYNGGWNSGMFDRSSGVITIPKSGYYFFSFSLRIDGFSGTYVHADIAGWNGSAVQTGASYRLLRTLESATASDYTALTTSGVCKVDKDDQYVLALLTSGDSSITLDGDAFMSCYYLG